jgi:hypothetical protein
LNYILRLTSIADSFQSDARDQPLVAHRRGTGRGGEAMLDALRGVCAFQQHTNTVMDCHVSRK